VPEKIIGTALWVGEIDPKIITSNEEKEGLNRRVVVRIEMEKESFFDWRWDKKKPEE
jgi:hypothetical protein